MLTRTQTLKADLQAAALALGLSNSALAAKVGLHRNSLKNFQSSRWSPNIRTLDLLERALLNPEPAVPRRRHHGTSTSIRP